MTLATRIHIASRTTSLSIWLIGVSFVLFQFFLQLSSGVVIGAIMHEMQLTAFTTGLLSGSFYVVYTGLQIPVGILFDRNNSRTLLAVNALICSLGCLIFASSHSLIGLFIGRLLIGAGSAFAFIGLSHLLRLYFPIQKFAFMIGLSETLGFIATAMGMFGMGALVNQWGWRGFINIASLLGIVISYACWRYIPNSQQNMRLQGHYSQLILQIILNGKAWINGFFVGLSFNIVTVFGALWAIPFSQAKLSCNLRQASIVCAVFFFGTALSCPLFGLLATQFTNRRPLILFSCLSTAILLLVLIYYPTESYTLVTLLMFMIGLCCGAYMLAYTVANELAPPGCQSTSAGFTNTLAVITTPLLQPFIGYLLDTYNHNGVYTLTDYQIALLVIPGSLIIAAILVCFLPEKKYDD